MQSTAKAHDTAAIQRMNDARVADKKEMAELLNRGNPDVNTAKFVEYVSYPYSHIASQMLSVHKLTIVLSHIIRDMNKKLYTSGEENIEDRLKKYSHYRQKGMSSYNLL
jgi:hypothetical protein